MNDDPLSKLIVDRTELDKEKLASLIVGNLGISKDGEIIILPGFVDLTTKSKILSFLLAKKASKVMSLSNTDKAPTKEVAQITGLPEGTVSRELFELKEMRLISNDQGYFVPDYAIHLISIEKNSDGKMQNNVKKRIKGTGKRTEVKAVTNKKSDKAQQLLQISQELIAPELIELLLKPGYILERALAVLKIGRDNGINDLTPAEIELFLKEKIRAGGVWKSNISLYLGKKGTLYVDRFRDSSGSGYTYRLMVQGEKLLEETLKKISSTTSKVNTPKNEENTE